MICSLKEIKDGLRLIDLQHQMRERVAQIARDKFDITLDSLVAETPPRTELGDLAFPIAFELAKRLKQATGEKRNPRAIAEEIAAALRESKEVARVEVAGAGYINVFYNRAQLIAESLDAKRESNADSSSSSTHKSIVEHTNINPNKAAHIGHLRNAVLGDTFVRILRAAGEQVEVQNYIDNTGVQVADVIVGFMHIENMTLADVKQLDAALPPERPFDYYCWDLYARTGLFYRNDSSEGAENPDRLALRSQTLHQIEAGDNEVAALADYVATRVVECHLNTMRRLDVTYDVLPRESEILHLKFWDAAFNRLKETGAIRLEETGRHAGCWVMPSTDAQHESTDEHEADKIIVRSNGTVTYAGKDIAYQLWKLGQLDQDFYYKPFQIEADNHIVWITTSDANDSSKDAPKFGAGTTIYNVIDSRQSYTQDVVKRGVAAVAPEIGGAASVHLGYEMVALSPAACEELGIKLSDADKAKQFIEMSGRKGLGVKADDLINRLEQRALVETQARHAELTDEEKRLTAHQIAIGALRYFLLKWTRNSIIAFDFKEALSFEGETGPYCQYAAVRANSIFRKLDENALQAATSFVQNVQNDDERRAAIDAILQGETGDELWTLWSLAARCDEAIQQSVQTIEPAHLAKYAFQLARAFNLFYHRHRIVSESDETRRAVLISIAMVTRTQLTSALETLGISVPERM